MNETRETWIPKDDWGNGPWQAEPDRIEWRTGGFVGLMLRNPRNGNWCGYLGVPPGHPWHGASFRYWGDEDDALEPPAVHGGVTFSDSCMEDDRPQRERVCHVPLEGEPSDVWWVGFDCHHGDDYAPLFEARSRERGYPGFGPWCVYRDEAYVRAEVESLAQQAVVS